ncbi:hypothetical protein VTJ04DRAFT_4808 [Mycothermus thermophilus]|uniref:uncharacterized protein n=1 Tax=Humicola insolens TaxID=85995 RepID=UPI003742E0C7
MQTQRVLSAAGSVARTISRYPGLATTGVVLTAATLGFRTGARLYEERELRRKLASPHYVTVERSGGGI